MNRISYTSFVFTPFLVIGMLQLGGCVRQENPAPPGGVYRSESAGAAFDQASDIQGQEGEYIANFNLRDVFRSPSNPEHIYVAADENGIIFSENDGKTWQIIPTPLTRTLDVLQLKNEVLVASGVDGEGQGFVIRSLDEGKSWQTVFTVPKPNNQQAFGAIQVRDPVASVVLSIAPDPFQDDRVYAGSNLGTIFVGEQSAKVWKNLQTVKDTGFGSAADSSNPIIALYPSPFVQDELFIITQTHQLFTIKNGTQEEIAVPEYISTPPPFAASDTRKGVFDVAFIQGFPDAFVLGVEDGVVVTRDRGKTWVQLQVPVEQSQKFNSIDVAISPTNPNRLLVAINNVIYRSEDGGQTWNTSAIYLPSHNIRNISINPENAAKVLAITSPTRT